MMQCCSGRFAGLELFEMAEEFLSPSPHEQRWLCAYCYLGFCFGLLDLIPVTNLFEALFGGCEPAKQSFFSGSAKSETRYRHVPRDDRISLAETVKDDMRDRFVPRDDMRLRGTKQSRLFCQCECRANSLVIASLRSNLAFPVWPALKPEITTSIVMTEYR